MYVSGSKKQAVISNSFVAYAAKQEAQLSQRPRDASCHGIFR